MLLNDPCLANIPSTDHYIISSLTTLYSNLISCTALCTVLRVRDVSPPVIFLCCQAFDAAKAIVHIFHFIDTNTSTLCWNIITFYWLCVLYIILIVVCLMNVHPICLSVSLMSKVINFMPSLALSVILQQWGR